MKLFFNKTASYSLMVVALVIGTSIYNGANAQVKKTVRKANTEKKVETDSILVPPPPPPPASKRNVRKVKAVRFTPPKIVKDSAK